MLRVLAQLDPIQALHDHWRHASPEGHYVIGTVGFVGWLQGIDWAAVLSFASLATLTFGGAAIQLWKQYRFAALEVRFKEADLRSKGPAPGPLRVVGDES